MASELRILAPSQAVVGEPIPITVVAVKENGRTDFEYGGTVRFSCTDSRAELPPPYTFLACELGRHKFSVTFRSAGVHRLEGFDDEVGISGRSAPIVVTEEPQEFKLYWGDLHGHTGEYACGFGTIDRYFVYARDYAVLDFCALTDHDHLPGHPLDLDTIWEKVKRAVAYYHRPHEFVTFLGYEWTTMRGQSPRHPDRYFGQRHVIYLGEDEPWFGCHKEEADTPEKLWRCLRGRDALVIVHHSAAPSQWGADWNFHDPELERLVEIYSAWGCSERPASAGNIKPIRAPGGEGERGHVQEALARGYRMGFCAGGDSHDGCPGATWFERPLGKGERQRFGWLYHGGLHGAWARELTREGLWEAFVQRRCYGTTGARIIVKFFVNGNWMGSEIRVRPSEPRTIRAEVWGTAPLAKVEVVKNNCDVASLPVEGERCMAEWVDHSPARNGDFYYLRVTQVDEEMAWASPVWVDVERG